MSNFERWDDQAPWDEETPIPGADQQHATPTALMMTDIGQKTTTSEPPDNALNCAPEASLKDKKPLLDDSSHDTDASSESGSSSTASDRGEYVYFVCCYVRLCLVHAIIVLLMGAIVIMLGIIISNSSAREPNHNINTIIAGGTIDGQDWNSQSNEVDGEIVSTNTSTENGTIIESGTTAFENGTATANDNSTSGVNETTTANSTDVVTSDFVGVPSESPSETIAPFSSWGPHAWNNSSETQTHENVIEGEIVYANDTLSSSDYGYYTTVPKKNPTASPSSIPTVSPSEAPTHKPSPQPTVSPTDHPSSSPTQPPTLATQDGEPDDDDDDDDLVDDDDSFGQEFPTEPPTSELEDEEAGENDISQPLLTASPTVAPIPNDIESEVFDDEEADQLNDSKPPKDSRFTIALYPDLQKLTKDRIEADGLDDSTRAIILRKDVLKIKMVLSVGDMVNVATTCEHQSRWDRVLRNVHKLDAAGIPFIPTCGNHDGCYKLYGAPSDYTKQFTDDYSCGRDPYIVSEKNPFYAGEFNGNSKTGFENSWYLFDDSGIKFILLSLRYGKRNDLENEWNQHTNRILADHRDRYGIILTHEAHDTHREHACNNPNVKLILQGHRHGGRKRERIDCGNGHTIQRFIFAFRHHEEQWIQEAAAIRFFTFQLGENKITMKTFSTHEGKWLDDSSACDDAPKSGKHCDVYSWQHKFY